MRQLHRVVWEDTDAPPITEEACEWLENFPLDHGDISLSLDDLEEHLKYYPADAKIQPLVDWLKKDLADGNYHDYAVSDG